MLPSHASMSGIPWSCLPKAASSVDVNDVDTCCIEVENVQVNSVIGWKSKSPG